MQTEVSVTSLPWDSDFWGQRSGRVQLDEDHPRSTDVVLGAIRRAQESYGFVQLLVPASQVAHAQVAERAGFRLVDLRCEVALDRAHAAALASDPFIKSATPRDVAPIADLAASSHGNSRFGSDEALDPTRVEEFYRQWIRRDVSMPDWALAVSKRDAQINGYISYGRDTAGNGTIGLVGVASHARGQGLGARLVAHAAASLFEAGCPRLTVVTQGGSLAAMKMYQRCGFEVVRLGYWLHWHRAVDRAPG